jgi:hypothetical protein
MLVSLSGDRPFMVPGGVRWATGLPARVCDAVNQAGHEFGPDLVETGGPVAALAEACAPLRGPSTATARAVLDPSAAAPAESARSPLDPPAT